ncbi:calcium/sodium antiporter [Chitinispirillales bacterium ANBcel5]|uniref:calcium/sodium antiporter n=1 Tax=Cellulosispirillum alkaliphilum TaxID=3039283 RepID=UPI002A51F159|nr:calcium/sodium antiporter [Chitinispirillales bacterium ANBcel5]
MLAWLVLIVAFIILAKCADLFVESAVVIADRFKIPKLVIGIVLVSLATTTPEMTVSLISAFRGKPEMALGNAIGSVICDDGIALALAGIVSVGVITIQPRVLKISATFLILLQLVTFFFVIGNNTLNRWQGGVLVSILAVYIAVLYHQHKRGKLHSEMELMELDREIEKEKKKSLKILSFVFLIGLGGIIISSELIVTSAVHIAGWMAIPQSVVALTIIALGTSLPEIATSVIAARKGEGQIAVGNILGADILNISWVAGVSAIANPLVLERREILFMFPSMFIIVGAMLIMLRMGYSLTRKKGIALLSLYILYVISFLLIFPRNN